MRPSQRTKTVKECDAAAMLLGDEWAYGHVSHTFFRRGWGHLIEWLCAETMQPLTRAECTKRRQQYREAADETD
jgi:hypothetical protein